MTDFFSLVYEPSTPPCVDLVKECKHRIEGVIGIPITPVSP